jgi:hypothetical protein
MLLGVPVSDPPADLVKKIEAALFSQVPEIADEIGDGMLIACSTMTLKYCYGVSSPGCVVLPLEHAFPPSRTNFSGRRSGAVRCSCDTAFRERDDAARILKPCHLIIGESTGRGFSALTFRKPFQCLQKIGRCIAQRKVIVCPTVSSRTSPAPRLDCG